MGISQLNDRAVHAEDQLRDLRSQYLPWIAGMRRNGHTAEADAAQAAFDTARAPLEAIIAERDALARGV